MYLMVVFKYVMMFWTSFQWNGCGSDVYHIKTFTANVISGYIPFAMWLSIPRAFDGPCLA